MDELLLFRRNRQLDAPVKSTLREQRERLFGILSFENLTDPAQPANLISWDRAIEVTTEIYGCKSRDVAAATLREVCKETGLMSEERSSETLRFIHLTFCEFLAAKEAIHGREAGWSELVSIHRSFSSDAAQSATKLVEVIPFAAGLMSRVMRAKMLDDVAILRDPRVFGRVFLETQAYDHPAWAFYAASEADYLTSTIRSHWNDDWLQRLHLFTVILADESEWRQAYNREPAAVTLEQLLKMLIQGDRERLVAVLGSYASVDPQAAFRLARSLEVDLVEDHPAIVIENLSNRPFRSLIVEDLASRKTPSLQQAMVLCEAAMANPYVAFALHEEPPTVLKFGTPSSIPRRFRWFVSGEPAAMSFGSNLFLLAYGLNLNLLTYSASIVANAHSVDVINTTTFPSCAQLAQLRAPGDFWFSKFLWLNKWLLLLPVSLLSIASAASVNAMLDSTWIGISVVVVFGVLAYWFSHNVAYYPKFRASYFAQFLQGVLQEFAGTRQFSRSDDGLVVFRPASLLARRASQPLIEAALSVRASPGSRKR
ncbi:hypothetical protein [Micromonospora sp. NPDC047740]|uniref:hypothetical protein n=1 Tax=Micromonospora sp. NPDC047740 TaxID=3364254 RepID=UPI0037181C7B